MMTMFDRMHLEHHEALYGFDRHILQRLSKMIGLSVEELEEYFRYERVGNVYGHAHSTTVVPIIERVIYQQGAQSLTLNITPEPGDESGHLNIKVMEVTYGTDDASDPD